MVGCQWAGSHGLTGPGERRKKKARRKKQEKSGTVSAQTTSTCRNTTCRRRKTDVPYGTLDLLILKTLDTMGPMHGYSLARRIEQVSETVVRLSQGSIYPAVIRLEQQGWIRTEWGVSETNRKVKVYRLTLLVLVSCTSRSASGKRPSRWLPVFSRRSHDAPPPAASSRRALHRRTARSRTGERNSGTPGVGREGRDCLRALARTGASRGTSPIWRHRRHARGASRRAQRALDRFALARCALWPCRIEARPDLHGRRSRCPRARHWRQRRRLQLDGCGALQAAAVLAAGANGPHVGDADANDGESDE